MAETRDRDQETKNKRLIESFWRALAARDWDGLKALVTDDVHYTDVGFDPVGARGPEGVVARLKVGLEALERYEHLPGTLMIAEGDIVMTEHTERWTFGTGELIEHPFLSVTQVRGGKICRWHDYSHISNITDNAPQWWRDAVAKAAAQARAPR